MKRKIAAIILAVALCAAQICAAASIVGAAPAKVVPSTQNLTLNGIGVDIFNAYNIDGNNYFKLRDIALLLGDCFSVTYADGVITLETGFTYEPDGSESKGKAEAFSKILPSNDAVFVNGYETEFDAYKIDGSNYYKLRDIGAKLGFVVAYNEESDTVELTKGTVSSVSDSEEGGLARQNKQLAELTLEEIEEYNKGIERVVVSDEEKQAAVDAKIDEIIAKYIKPGMSDLDKERVIHDWLIINTSYGICGNKVRAEHTPYNLLIMGHGVCSAYARTMKLFMDKLGIPCEYVSGYPAGGGTGHAWNRVQIGGVWYELDVTWDEPQSLSGNSLTDEIYSPYSREKRPSGNEKWPNTRFVVVYKYFNRATKGFGHSRYIRDEDATPCETNMPQETVLNAETLPGRVLDPNALRGGGPGYYDDDYSDYMYPERYSLFFSDVQNLIDQLVAMGVRRDALPVYDAKQNQVSILDVTTRQYMRATLEHLQYINAESIPVVVSYEYYTGKAYTSKYQGGISSSRLLEFGELPIGSVASPARYFILEGDVNTLAVDLTISMGAPPAGALPSEQTGADGVNAYAHLVAPAWDDYFGTVLAPGETQRTVVVDTITNIYDMAHYAEKWLEAELGDEAYSHWRDTLITFRYDYSPTVPVGKVISQFPSSGEPVDFNKGIQITASLGDRSVPDFVGLTLAEAQELRDYIIAQRQLYVTFSSGTPDVYRFSDTYPMGVILGQSPAAGEPMGDEHANVRYSLSIGPFPIMPDVVGLDMGYALERIDEADTLMHENYKNLTGDYWMKILGYGKRNSTRREEYSDTVPRGAVISTSPAAGERCDLNDENFKVVFVVSKGPG